MHETKENIFILLRKGILIEKNSIRQPHTNMEIANINLSLVFVMVYHLATFLQTVLFINLFIL